MELKLVFQEYLVRHVGCRSTQRILDDAAIVITRLRQVKAKTFGISVGDAKHLKTEKELDDQASILKKVPAICKDNGIEAMTAMFSSAGFTNIKTTDTKQAPGLDIHEMGGARMGHNPKTSLLNNWNQLHHCKNVFVTDGACMTSTSTQNPSLTYMALTARAVDYSIQQLKRNNI